VIQDVRLSDAGVGPSYDREFDKYFERGIVSRDSATKPRPVATRTLVIGPG